MGFRKLASKLRKTASFHWAKRKPSEALPQATPPPVAVSVTNDSDDSLFTRELSIESFFETPSSASSPHKKKQQARRLPRAAFCDLCKARKFEQILSILRQDEKYNIPAWLAGQSSRNSRSKSESMHTFRGESPLHMLVQYNPGNVSVVDAVAAVLNRHGNNVPPAEDAMDMLGNTPLHTAVLHGCNPTILQRLVSGPSLVMPALTRNARQQLPLHVVCTTKSYASATQHVVALDIVLQAHPEGVTATDQMNNTPYAAALKARAPSQVLELLQAQEGAWKPAVAAATAKKSSTPPPASVVGCCNDNDDDDVSSIGSCGVSMIPSNKQLKKTTESKFHDVSINEVLKYVEEQQRLQHEAALRGETPQPLDMQALLRELQK